MREVAANTRPTNIMWQSMKMPNPELIDVANSERAAHLRAPAYDDKRRSETAQTGRWC